MLKSAWSEQELELVKNLYPRAPREEIERKLPGRTWTAIQRLAGRYDFKRIIMTRGRPKSESLTPENIYYYFQKELKTSPYVKLPYRKTFRGKQHEEAILMLSDAHGGKRNIFLNPESGKNDETYNTEIMIRKLNRLAESIYSVAKLLSPSYKIDKLHIVALGDMIDNDRIYPGQKFWIDAGVGEQLWITTKALADFFKTMLKIFKYIEVIWITGNHGRTTSRMTAEPVTNYFEYHLGRIFQIIFKNERRIRFTVPDNWYYLHKVKNWRYLCHHGNITYSFMGLPYYGLVRAGKARRIEVPFDIELIAHFHQAMEIPVSASSFTLVNGSFIPCESFAWQKFGVLSRPEQYFFGVSNKYPKTWSFKLRL